MTTRYQKEHYEDVARLLKKRRPSDTLGAAAPVTAMMLTWKAVCRDFADLFAADNPQRCTAHVACPYNYSDGRDNDCHIYGFDRERFLEDCGRTSEPDVLAELEEKANHWEEGYPHGLESEG
jgi:hypothetical protein